MSTYMDIVERVLEDHNSTTDGGGESQEDYYLGQPVIRTWELAEDSSHYDRLRAAPSNEQMKAMWIGWSTAFFLFSGFNLVVFLSVLCTKQTRRQPFNRYLLAIMWPDVFYTGMCAFQCAFLAGTGGYSSAFTCHFQSFYLVWSITANGWLNGVVAHEIHILLKSSARRLRYFPPTTKRIVTRVALCYFMGLFMASWGVLGQEFPSKFFPHKTDVFHGLVCMPLEYDTASTVFFWLCFFPLMIAIPVFFTSYVVIDVRRNNLLPPQGKRREVAIFFFRIVIVFLSMWLPSLLVFYLSASAKNIYGFYIGGLWAHTQGAASAAVSMLKSDIRQAVKNFVTCNTRKVNQQFEQNLLGVGSRRRDFQQRADLFRSTNWSHFSSRFFFQSTGNNTPNPSSAAMRSVVSSSNTNAPYPFASASQEFKTIHEGVDESSRYNNNAAGAFDDLDLEMLNTFEGGNYNTTTTTKVSQSVPSPIGSMDNLPDATATCTATQCDVLPGSHNSSGEPTPIDLGGLPIEKKNENGNKETQTEIDAEEGNLLPSTERQSPLQGFEEIQLQDSTANGIDATNRAELPTNATTRGAEHD